MNLLNISRRILLPFIAVVLILLAELAWWIVFHVRQSNHLAEQRLSALAAESDFANLYLVLLARQAGEVPLAPKPELLAHFPHLIWQKDASYVTPGEQTSSHFAFPGYRISIKPDFVAAIHDERARSIRMFIAEGLAFFSMIIAGFFLILGSMRREMEMLRQQGNFMSAVTHELKSPLASIRLYTETMQLREASPEKRAQYLSAMHQEVDRLEGLVGNLLQVARIDDKNFKPRTQALDLGQTVLAIVASLRMELQARGIQLQEDLRATPSVFVEADHEALITIVRNLLDNAAKYGTTPESAVVNVRIYSDARFGYVEVSDSGMGLAQHEKSRIFNKFYRVGDEMIRQTPGSGLGLYIVRALSRRSGGDATVYSKGLGHGSTFTVKMPRATGAYAETRR